MITLPKPQKYSSRLTSIEKISSKVYLERFDLIEPSEITFIAGQTVMLYVAPACAGRPGINRSMSIASAPSEKNSILLAHDIAPNGPYSRWALSAKVGDEMRFMGPLGAFVIDRESTRKKVFVATGTGIAPFRSMIRELGEIGELKKKTQVALYWGLRHEEDIFWQKEFEGLAQNNPNFQFILTLSQPSDAWQGKRGHVQDYIFAGQSLANSDYYLCGNRAMVDDMKVKLAAAGVALSQIKSELFY